MKLFHDEVREKKRTASNVHKMKGKRGYVGKVFFTSDLLKGKAKKDYQGTGKVRVWNMYDDKMNKQAFESMTEEEQKQALTRWRDLTTNGEIMDALEIKSSGAFHNILTKLEVPRKQRGGSKRGRKKKNTKKAEPILEVVPEVDTDQEPKPKRKGMSFHWDLEDAEKNEIKDMLTKLEFLVENDNDKKFSVKIELEELLD